MSVFFSIHESMSGRLRGKSRCKIQRFGSCTYQPTGRPLELWQVLWDTEAQARLERIPIVFIRQKVKKGLEAYAERNAIPLITPEVMKKAMAGEGRPEMFKKMPSFMGNSKPKSKQ